MTIDDNNKVIDFMFINIGIHIYADVTVLRVSLYVFQ